MQPIANHLAEILDLARWAPSGDNTQPWRFEVIDGNRVIVHGFDTREHCVYDLDGRPSQIAHGALLETLAIAASAHGLRAEFRRHPDSMETHPTYEVNLVPDPRITPDPLLPWVARRSVQRRMMRTKPLSPGEKQALHDVVREFCVVRWFDGGTQRWRLAKLMFDNAKLRLTLPEAYPVHREIIEWNARFSEDKVPDQALGLDVVTLKLMRWVMGSWERVRFFNSYLAGHVLPRLEMDLFPGLFCAAHFALVARRLPRTVDDYVEAGRVVQRFWLTATSLGLGFQPEVTPLIFVRYVRAGIPFSKDADSCRQAQALVGRLDAVLGEDASRAFFMGRLGHAPLPKARSLRLPMQKLLCRREK
jgi:hypothetical protein